MILLDSIRRNADGLGRIGMRALHEAQQAGVAIYYMDPAFGNDVIREFPDGRRERLVDEQAGAWISIPPRD